MNCHPCTSAMRSTANGGTGRNGHFTAIADAQAIRRVLTNRVVQVTWGEPSASVRFPVNIDEGSKAGLPSVLGARPDEQQLLAYFHGRISEEDLIEFWSRQVAKTLTGVPAPTLQEAERLRQLQSYLLRDFVESLFGLAETLRQSMRSPRAFEQALVGDFSPVSLAEQVLQAFRAGRRSPTAAAFQFVELIRVVAGLQFEGEEAGRKENGRHWKKFVRGGLARLLSLAGMCRRAGGLSADLHRPRFLTLRRGLAATAARQAVGEHRPEGRRLLLPRNP